jgi:hypothetical protein
MVPLIKQIVMAINESQPRAAFAVNASPFKEGIDVLVIIDVR